MRDDLIEIRKNVFLSKNDPDFYQKYLKINQNDSKMWFEYAQKLKEQGLRDQSLEVLKKASASGSRLAQFELDKLAKDERGKIYKQHKQQILNERLKKEKAMKRAAWTLFIAFLLLLLLLLLNLYRNSWIVHENEYHIYREKAVLHEAYNAKAASRTTHEATNASTKDLELIVLSNAIRHYEEMNGQSLTDLNALAGAVPMNWISGTAGENLNTAPAAIKRVSEDIELHYYPATRQLGFIVGGEIMKLYPVAYGEELPFQTSTVQRRVVNPNGGDGPLGTRGLELQDQYAIHGTNDPSSIGKQVTKGCLRLHNEDIEELYPFIPLRTPFLVLNDVEPGNAVYGADDKLPISGDYVDPEKESYEETRFQWKR